MGGPSYRADNHCGTPCRKVCTSCFALMWLLLAFGTVMVHIGVIKLAPPLADLPYNFEKGFNDVLGFADLGPDAQRVQDAAEAALQTCNFMTTQCSVPAYTVSGSSDTTQYKGEIQAAFANSLSTIERVATDRYFGTEELNQTAAELHEITEAMEDLPDGNQDCRITVPLYCDIHQASVGIHAELGTVNGQIDEFCNTGIMQDWKDNGEKIEYLHGLPYFAWIAMLMFFVFWKRDAACACCCGGSMLGCILLIFYALFWLIAFAVSSIFAGAGAAVIYAADKIEIPDGTFKGNPNVKELLDHIETDFADFWNLVFADLVDGGKTFWAGFVIIDLILLLIIGYGLSVCCCSVYREQGEKKESS